MLIVGILIGLIPKLVEGPSVRYITGGGASKPTVDRVLLFEREGNIHAKKREGRAMCSGGKAISHSNSSNRLASSSSSHYLQHNQQHDSSGYSTDE